MTQPASTIPVQRRPDKPRRGPLGPFALVVVLLLSWWAGSDRFGIGFSPVELARNFSRGGRIVSDFFPPLWRYWPAVVGPLVETLRIAIIATVLGCALALVVSFLASRVTAPNLGVYLADKGVLNVVRAMPEVLYGLILVAAVGIGGLAGVITLTLFTVGVVAKLLSETIDATDLGPMEAAQAAGAGRFAQTRTAMLPQVLPSYLAYSLYAFELNVRAAAVLGFIGISGIGQAIEVERAAYRYDRISVILLALFIAVFVIEQVSSALRRRLV